MKDRPLLSVIASLLAAALVIAWGFAQSDHEIDQSERIILAVIGSMLVVVLFVSWLYTRQRHAADARSSHSNAKLDEIHGEVQSVHTRHDHADQRGEHQDSKLSKLRRGFSLLFHGDTVESHKAFSDWWRSWTDHDE